MGDSLKRNIVNPAKLDQWLDEQRANFQPMYDSIAPGNTPTARLYVNMFAGILITLGIVFAEKNAELVVRDWGIWIAQFMFFVGWYLLIVNSPRGAILGMFIPVWAAIAQYYFTMTMKKRVMARSEQSMATMAVVAVFVAMWAIYIYVGYNNSFSWTGLVLMLFGMAYYFIERRSSIYALLGRDAIGPTMVHNSLIFSPGIALVASGWAFLAVGFSAIQV